MAQWEESKAIRRAAILDAARDLMSAPDGVSFSMRKLAQRADVSVATPYNLFGSKQAILAALLKEGANRLEAYLDDQAGDEIDAFFMAAAVMSFAYEQQPDYHRNLISAAYQSGGPETRREMGVSAVQLWQKLFAEAIAEGFLTEDVSARVFAVTFGELLLTNVLIWAHGLISIEEMKARNQFGVALLLLGCATGKGRARLIPYRTDAENILEAYWDALVADDNAGANNKNRNEAS
ncbi:MAG: TetR/AcrR family transcriptional regulator [Parvibaculaceae bacterium]|nr:TetR/AcrR family transcriptional regulator [Parvibaculaceae bacterium]